MICNCIQSFPIFILKCYFLFQAHWDLPLTNMSLCRTHIKLGHQENKLKSYCLVIWTWTTKEFHHNLLGIWYLIKKMFKWRGKHLNRIVLTKYQANPKEWLVSYFHYKTQRCIPVDPFSYVKTLVKGQIN